MPGHEPLICARCGEPATKSHQGWNFCDAHFPYVVLAFSADQHEFFASEPGDSVNYVYHKYEAVDPQPDHVVIKE